METVTVCGCLHPASAHYCCTMTII